jgi:hypothetical protein
MEMNITPLSLAHYYKTYVWLVEEGDVTCRAEIGAHVLRERERERGGLSCGRRNSTYVLHHKLPKYLTLQDMLELLAMEETLVYIRCLGH